MIKYLLITLSLSLCLQANPYKELDSNIKLNLMINYFLNLELKKIVPTEPIKEEIQEDGLSLDPVKYEKYYNYIQRIKAIHESRAAEQKDIDEKYLGKVAFYNGKLKVLKRFYAKDKNLNPLLQTSINKALKVVYGKPKLININYNEKDNSFYGVLTIIDIYNINKFENRKIKINVPKNKQLFFKNSIDKVKINVQFDYRNDSLILKDILCLFEDKKYNGIFVNNTNEKIKLNIKINDDIFRLIPNKIITKDKK